MKKQFLMVGVLVTMLIVGCAPAPAGQPEEAEPTPTDEPTAEATEVPTEVVEDTHTMDEPFEVAYGETAVLDGFTLDGGSPNGAVYNAQATPTFRHCTFQGGQPSVLNVAFARPIFANCLFTNNPAGGLVSINASPLVTNCLFANNVSIFGGAAYSGGGEPRFVDCTFRSNSASYGGALGVDADVLQRRVDQFRPLLLRASLPDVQRLDDDVAHLAARVERGDRVLEDHLHPRPRLAHRLLVERREIGALEHHRTGRRRRELHHRPTRGGLSASRSTHDRRDSAAAEFQRDIGKDHAFVITERNMIDVEKDVGTQGLTAHRRSDARVPIVGWSVGRCDASGSASPKP